MENVVKKKIYSLDRKEMAPLWVATSALIVFALSYSLSVLLPPFWNDHDTWSNLLPIIHFKHSIPDQHTLPLFTDLWYDGRAQWANPLWSFLYLPSTIVWLIVFINAKGIITTGLLKPNSFQLLPFISAVQIAASVWVIRQEGSIHSPYEESVQHVADLLKADHYRVVCSK